MGMCLHLADVSTTVFFSSFSFCRLFFFFCAFVPNTVRENSSILSTFLLLLLLLFPRLSLDLLPYWTPNPAALSTKKSQTSLRAKLDFEPALWVLGNSVELLRISRSWYSVEFRGWGRWVGVWSDNQAWNLGWVSFGPALSASKFCLEAEQDRNPGIPLVGWH